MTLHHNEFMAEPAGQGAYAPNRRLLLSFAGLMLLFTLGDIFRGQQVSAQKETPAPKFASKFMGPSIKFLYCYS